MALQTVLAFNGLELRFPAATSRDLIAALKNTKPEIGVLILGPVELAEWRVIDRG